MKIEEAALTGESVPVEKHADAIELAAGVDMTCLGRPQEIRAAAAPRYSTAAATRRCSRGISMDTEMGKIAGALSEAKEELTPLQVKLAELSKILTILVIVICVVIFGVDIIRHGVGNVLTDPILDTFQRLSPGRVAARFPRACRRCHHRASLGVPRWLSAYHPQALCRRDLGCTHHLLRTRRARWTQNKMTVVKHELA